MGDPPPPYHQGSLYPNLPPSGALYYGAPPPGVQPVSNYPPTGASKHSSSESSKHGGGLFNSLIKTAGKAVSSAGNLASAAIHEIGSTVDKYSQSPTMNLFQTNNVVQLISRTTGKALQILLASSGELVLDGLGPETPQAFNTLFTVSRLKHNIVYLHNNYNYMAITNGYVTLRPAAPGSQPPINCQFSLHEPSYNFVSMESMSEKGCCVGILPTGQAKSAMATSRTDKDAQFAVRLISSPYGSTGMPSPTQSSPYS